MIRWRCADCGTVLDGGDNGPYLSAVTAHLHAAHGDVPFMEAWDAFRHEPGRPATATTTAKAARDEAVQRVDDAADPDWKTEAQATVERLARSRAEFISDAVWDLGLTRPAEPRALGPIMLWAQRQGLIEPTDRLETSAQVASHAMPRRVWRSLVYAP